MHEAGTAGPFIAGSRFGQHRHVGDIAVLSRPLFRQGILVEIDARLGAPVDEHRSLAFFGDGVFDNGLDRRETGATSKQDHRFLRVFTQVAHVLCVDTVSYTHLTLPTICSVQISVVAVSLKKKKKNKEKKINKKKKHLKKKNSVKKKIEREQELEVNRNKEI
eukprot:TRINITY_DN4963_c0_g1_i1.p3 TRINITY_DN4963_c0_g1~~TRINITY_DN4963_c0_g1_i1.p3  ORF type:complete len:163 (+),score=39.55 TRINITY_DN4963_c0_g1_i1:1086-1574(+)